MESVIEIVQQQAEDTVKKLGVQGVITAERVVGSVLSQTAYWEVLMPNNTEKVMFIRFFSPVVQREEVFLGNVLFNAFVSKAFARAITHGELGRAELVANDLENYYFLVRTSSDVSQITTAFCAEVERSLPDLFFAEQDDASGVYGDLSRMFAFRKSDFEPFPVYAVPRFLAPQLEKAVRQELDKLLSPSVFPNRVRTVLAALAFFYGRTSGGSGDAQSFPSFVDHLVNDKDYDGLLKAADVAKALNIVAVAKPAIKQSIDDGTYSTERMRDVLYGLMQAFRTSIDSGSPKWLMGFLHKDDKFVGLSSSAYLATLIADIRLGYHLFAAPIVEKLVPCRLCNAAQGAVEERYVTTGLNSFRFDNQNVRRQTEKACVKCALHSYLAQKLLGTEMVSAGGKLPQVAKTYNLILHYGKHNQDDVDRLVHNIDLTWTLVRQHRDTEQIRREVQSQIRDIQAKCEREKNAKKKRALADDLVQKEDELRRAKAAVATVEDGIFAACPWLKESGASPVPAENCSLDTLSNIQLSETKVERHILGLGMGGYRMILFVLPQVRAPRDAKEHDFAQRRFSDSRVTVMALLSFLREMCGCDGPFYYQSLPTLTPDAFERDTFYVRNEPINAKKAQDEYEAVTQLAWRLVPQRGSDGFVRKVVLAEKLLDDPLGTFATVMRDSAILGQTKGSYKRMGVRYREDWRAQDLTEYSRFIQRLSVLQEVR